MSSPPNRLAVYRSYSFYHVLAICDTTATASALAYSKNLGVWQHPSKDTAPSGRYSPKDIDLTDTTKGQYCVLINGSTDAAYTISTVNWSSTTAGAATENDMYTSVALEGFLTISEPKGIVFLDQIVNCCAKLNVDSANSVFILKTFFIGYGVDSTGTDYVDTIVDVAPLIFTVIDVTGTFSAAGGIYNMSFVSCVDGTARLPQYSKLGNTIHIKAGDSLNSTLKAFEKAINDNYTRYFNCVKSSVKAAFSAAGQEASIAEKVLTAVTYHVDVIKPYDSNDYKVSDTPAQAKDTTGCGDPSHISIPAQTSIEDGIRFILSASPQVQRDMAVGTNNGNAGNALIKYEYRIRTFVKSALIKTELVNGVNVKHFSYDVHYQVYPFMVPKEVANLTAFTGVNIDDNIINFDYIYTGKNIDILEFDMKLNYGLAYLQVATTGHSFKGQLSSAQNRTSTLSNLDLSHLVQTGDIRSMPVYFGTQVTAPAALNKNNGAQAVQSVYTLAKHSSIELTEATVRITGNPTLLSTVNKTSSPESAAASATANSPRQLQDITTTPVNDNADFKFWSYVPAFITINIKMPRNNDDISTFSGQVTDSDANATTLDYAQDFWFKGKYYVLGIDHMFEDGVFTQTLHILAIPPKDSLDALENKQDPGNSDLTQPIEECFDSKTGCGNQTAPASPATSATQPASAPMVANGEIQAGGNQPTDQSTADTVNATAVNAGDLSNVIGWDASTNSVKQAIVTAANKYGVNVVTLAMIAAQESSFNPIAQNPKSTAFGLYQFVDSTWFHYFPGDKGLAENAIQQHKADPLASADAGARFLADNIQAIGSANPGDVYLAHFGGPKLASTVVQLCNNSQGNSSVQTVVLPIVYPGTTPFTPKPKAGQSSITYPNKAAYEYAAINTANNNLLVQYSTATTLRAWAAGVMAKRLRSGTIPISAPPANPKWYQRFQSPLAVAEEKAAKDKIATHTPCSTDEEKAKTAEGNCVTTPADNSLPKQVPSAGVSNNPNRGKGYKG